MTIKNLTPEGGNVSYWTSGSRVFNNGTPGAYGTFDTTFFHWAHTNDTQQDKMKMQLAISKRDTLRAKKLPTKEIESDGYITLPESIPRDAICIIEIEADIYPNQGNRETAQLLEQELFRTIESAMLEQRFEPGGNIKVNLDLRPRH